MFACPWSYIRGSGDGSDGYQVKAGMTGQARQLDDAGTDTDGVGSAVRSRRSYLYDDAGGHESAYRSGVGTARAVSGSGLRTNAAVPRWVAPLQDSRGP
ncbi:hypothetical protein GCM10017776_60400 [Streptomyces griseoluteus]|nr:hypothetical protein GCM10017776_60400 [Streptomyces griseoluteus]